MFGDAIGEVAERALDGLGLAVVRRGPVDLVDQGSQHAERVVVADLEAVARRRAAGEELVGEAAAVVEQDRARQAIGAGHVGERQPHQRAVLGLADAACQHLAAVDVLPEQAQRPGDGAVRPAAEHVEAMAVGIDRFQRGIHGVVALLRWEGAHQRFLAFAREDHHLPRQLALDFAFERAQARQRPAFARGDALHALIAAGRAGRGRAQVVGLELVPGAGGHAGVAVAAGVGRQQRGRATVGRHAGDIRGPAAQAGHTAAAHAIALELRGDDGARIEHAAAAGDQGVDGKQRLEAAVGDVLVRLRGAIEARPGGSAAGVGPGGGLLRTTSQSVVGNHFARCQQQVGLGLGGKRREGVFVAFAALAVARCPAVAMSGCSHASLGGRKARQTGQF